jgi:hypothetical protein
MTSDQTAFWIAIRHRRRGTAITTAALARVLGWSTRKVQRIAQEGITTDAFPYAVACVCTGKRKGYFVLAPDDPQSAEEANHEIRSLLSRIAAIDARRRGLEGALRRTGYMENSAGDFFLPQPLGLFDRVGIPRELVGVGQ